MVHPDGSIGVPDTDDETFDSPAGDAPEHRIAVVDAAHHVGRLDKAVVAMAPEFSRNYLQSLIEGGHVRVGGRVVTKQASKVHAGETVDVELVPTPESRAFRPEDIPLDVVHEDAHVMVVNKPAGMVVHPAAGNWSGTLLNAVLHRHPDAASLPRAGIVHRLDKDTSGLMVVGRSLAAVTSLVRSISAREVHREYLALAMGTLRSDPFSIDSPLGRDPQSRVRMAVLASGREARTDVTPLAIHEPGDAPAVTAVRCKLHTGRTHQIRVHLMSRGHPLVADALYGGRPALGLVRQALHAARLGFAHPADGTWCEFEAPLPADLDAAWRTVVGDAS